MIRTTRFTVDEATRDVLEQLSGKLSQPPSWLPPLKAGLEQRIDEMKEAAVDGPTKSLRQLLTLASSQQLLLDEMQSALLNLSGADGQNANASTDAIKRLDASVRQVADRQQDCAVFLAEAMDATRTMFAQIRAEQASQRELLMALAKRMDAASSSVVNE